MYVQQRIDPQRFADPLAAFVAAHHAHQSICDAFAAFCADPDRWADGAAAAGFHAFLVRDLPEHVEDEEEVLLPVLGRLGLLAEDAADAALAASQHERDRRLTASLVPELARLAQGLPAGRPAAFAARGAAFVHGYRRHIVLEETTILRHAADLDAAHRQEVIDAMAMRRRARG